ncbi:tRNA uridine-5-carboxymethylaminomethyl(34) synthesis GTPase MnmE [bacterium]|nr:tRNA uridine-5-carboxymethylaminomethyl(34) synthesis GTPase MnmE [bacterium]
MRRTGTIAAISTPLGEGGIGIVRLSGPQSLAIADRIFQARDGIKLSKSPTHTLHYGHIIENGGIIDEVLLTVMRAPRTYTKEDIVEINCHGGIMPLGGVLELVLKNGASLAEPGEFTKRAFLNGRIDLTQAEAVVDVIRAKTALSLRAAVSQLKGNFSRKVEDARHNLLNLLVKVEASVDFPGEDAVKQHWPKAGVETLNRQEVKEGLSGMVDSLSKLIATAKSGKLLREGIKVAICGKPNVGKSTLFNALLGEDRAIVTATAGTTRDTIEETINAEGFPVNLMDTAGLRKPRGEIGKESVIRSRRSMKEADLVLLVLDDSEVLSCEDKVIMGEVKDKTTILVINKIDLPQRLNMDEAKKALPDKRIVRISAIRKTGFSQLKRAIVGMFWQGGVLSPETALVTNARYKNALLMARESLQNARESLGSQVPLEFIALDIRSSINVLGEIVGEVATEDILKEIFSRFCIGK